MVKCHSIIIEPWFDGSTPREKRSAPCFRWTVTYEKNGSFQAQGFEDTHKSARDAAEAYLRENGIDIDWVTLGAKEEEPKPRWTPFRSQQSVGHTTIYSEVDHGTSVKLSMPRSQDGAAETNAKDDAVEFARGSERILVVEDDPGVRKAAAIILRNQGYEIVASRGFFDRRTTATIRRSTTSSERLTPSSTAAYVCFASLRNSSRASSASSPSSRLGLIARSLHGSMSPRARALTP